MTVVRLPPPPMPAWLRSELPFERYAVSVAGHTMHVMEQGEGLPVVLLHGNPTWGFLYRRVAQALRGEKLRLIMPDLVGLGFSSKPRDPSVHTLANHGAWFGGLLDALEIDRCVFVGQDWGGPIGLRAFADRPSRLAGMVILNTALFPPRPGFRPTAFHRFARMPLISDFAFRILGFPQIALHTAQGDKNSIRGDVARAYWWPLKEIEDNVAPLALARMVPNSLEHPSVPELQRCLECAIGFTGPSSIVWGTKDPVLGRVLKRMRETLPNAEVTVTSAGHFLQEEVPDEIAAAVRSVVSRLG